MATQWLKNLSHKAAHVKMLNPVYNASLGKPDDLLNFESFPHDLFPGDAGRGRWLASGQLDIYGHRVPLDQKNWLIGCAEQETVFFEKLHAFEFLTELKALGGDVGRKSARDLTQNWLDNFQNYHHIVWSPDLTAQRLVNWLIMYSYAYEAASDEFLEQMHNSFYRQFKHLLHALSAQSDIGAFERYSILWALIIVQCHCNDLYEELQFSSHLQLLKGVIDDISLPDDGLIDRNPQNLVQLGKSLIQLRHSLIQSGQTLPLWLGKKIETTARIINSMTHCDKDFPLFQGAFLPNKAEIEMVLKQSESRLRRSNICYNDYGYTTARNARTSLIIDHGNKGGHNAPLSFELAYGANRMIVSCGCHLTDSQWQDGLSMMAAHSCLMVGDSEAKQSMLNCKASLESLNGAVLFCGSHSGYVAAYGLNHTRRLYLDSDGEDFRGEELLSRNVAIKPLPVTLRFHLHPSVKASMVENKTAILLRLPSGSGWVFKMQGGDAALEESVYCADGFTVRKTTQIVIRAEMDDLSLQMKWAIKKQ